VGPAELALANTVFQIGGQAIAAEDTGERLAQDNLQHVGAAGRGNAVEDKRAGHEGPEPPFIAVGPVARLIGVDDGLVPQRRFELPIGRRDGCAGFLPGVLSTAQTDWHLERAVEEALHDQSGHAAHDRQIRDQSRQLRPELRGVLVRQRGQRDRAALRTLTTMAAILGDVRGNRRHRCDLMPTRLADGMSRVQAARAMATRLRREIHNRIPALGRYQLPMAARMAWLPAGAAATFPATPSFPLSTREAIRGRRLRGDGGVLLVQRELTLKIGNPLRLLLELCAKSFVLLTQPVEFLRLAITRVARWLVASRPLLALSRHRRERTKSLQKVQVQIVPKCQRA
jgi:hypothetical protein